MRDTGRTTVRVKIPADVYQLEQWWHLTLEPPYWYLRCRTCDQRQYLPWDARLRTAAALEILRNHSKECCEAQIAAELDALAGGAA